MKIVEFGEKTSILPDTTVKGVELDNMGDALELAQVLCSMAKRYLDPDTSPILSLTAPLGLEALRVQSTLLDHLASKADPDVPFTFLALDAPKGILDFVNINPFDKSHGQAGRILRGAVEDAEKPDLMRPRELSFPSIYLPVNSTT